ncbi:MAG TPA: alpha/beta hydrolase [Actinomycetota bacterium]|jgi:2-hydroxymuconate-semialdehyde hydrolase|nr:alpha/beta hydrolase [Actinomycetota bacterium]
MTTQMKAKGSTRRSNDEELRRRLLAGIRVTERRLEVAGVSTALLEGGEGPPIVLLHGGIETGGVYWAPVMSRLAESHRLVIPDVPGLGESEPLGRLDDVSFAEWFAALLRLTCHEKPTLVSHSLDGSLAARFATQHGDLLRALVLYGAPGIGAYRLPLGLLVTAIRFNVRPTDRNNARFADWAFLDPERTRRRDPEWYDAFMAYGLSRGKAPSIKRTMRQLVKAGSKQISDADLRGIGVPVALIWGKRDRMVPLRIADLASAKFGWSLHVVDDAGHVPHIEQPGAFLDTLGASLV